MPERPPKKKSARTTPPKRRPSVAKPASSGKKSAKARQPRSISQTKRSKGRATRKKLSTFDQFVSEKGLVELSDLNRLLLFFGDLDVSAALKSLPSPHTAFTIRCEYRLATLVPAPYTCPVGPKETKKTREAFPAKRTLTVVLGVAGKNYAYARHEGAGHVVGLAVCQRVDGSILFDQWLKTLNRAQSFVNSSPMSPEYFNAEPDLYELTPMIEEALDVKLC